ncbi:hypothetical protein VPH35_128609 [Triticum aestivum]
MDLGVTLHASADTALTAYSDEDWAGCPDTHRSTSGYCVYLGHSLISWSSKRQPTVSRPSAEAEYRAVANAVAECSWLRQLLQELSYPVDPDARLGGTASESAVAGSTAGLGAVGAVASSKVPGARAGMCVLANSSAAAGSVATVAAKGAATSSLHREEQEERVAVQAACAKHVQFGVPTPSNSGSDLSNGKIRCQEGQDLVISFNTTSSKSIEFRGASLAPPACKKVCGERVETLVGIYGNMVHVTKEVDVGEDEVQGRRRESMGEGKDGEGSAKEATNPGAVGQLTGASDDARQEP